jgi:hypothetical protein
MGAWAKMSTEHNSLIKETYKCSFFVVGKKRAVVRQEFSVYYTIS